MITPFLQCFKESEIYVIKKNPSCIIKQKRSENQYCPSFFPFKFCYIMNEIYFEQIYTMFVIPYNYFVLLCIFMYVCSYYLALLCIFDTVSLYLKMYAK